ncbi:MAG: PHB depolymerase family esterase [Bacteroidota bacterium]
MRVLLTAAILSGLLSASISCSPGGHAKDGPALRLPVPGVVHDRITGFTDKDISYAVYIPAPARSTAGDGMETSGKGKKLLPVVLAFDPHGSGVLPVKKYKDLADKYNFILVGSNNSRNGQPGDEMKGIITSMLREVLSVYPVDSSRVCVAGFSGGSRVAAIAAITTGKVKAVIGCGAGLPGGMQQQAFNFDYFGIVGTADFNMNEMLELDLPMTKAGMRHFITTFPGPHGWPPDSIFEEGVQWITLNAMRDGKLKKDPGFIASVMNRFGERAGKASRENHLIAAAEICREAIRFAEGLTPSDKFKEQENQIEKNPAYQRQIDYRSAILKREMEEQQLFQNSLAANDLSWWKKRIATMDPGNMKGKNPEDTLMNSRLKAFLSLLCYSYANAAIRQQNIPAAERIIAIYETADKPNPEPNYMRAILLAARAESKGAMDQLKVAVSKGFAETERMMQQPEFQSLKSSPGWYELLKTIK